MFLHGDRVAKERALDIFVLLDQIDRKNYDLWDKLTEEQRKEFSPLVTMRWMTGTTDPLQLIFLNEIVNIMVFPLGDKKELFLKLLTVCSNGRPKRYQWINYKTSGSGKKQKRATQLIAAHYQLSIKEAEDSRLLFSVEELMELGELHGLQKDELLNLRKEVSLPRTTSTRFSTS
jgi:hypothetical protein